MNIWILHQEANTPQENGPTRHIEMARALAAQNCHVTLILSDFSHTSKKRRESIDFDHTNIELLMLPTPSYTKNNWKRLYAMLVFALQAIFSKYKGKARPDIIIGSSPSPFTAFAAYFLSRRYKIPFIYEIRDLWPETLVKLGGVKPYHPVVGLLSGIEKFLAKRADLILGVLPGLPDYLSKYKIDKNKIFYFPNFSNFDHPPVFEEILSNKTFTVLYAGSHGLANSLDTLIEAANILQQQDQSTIRFQLIGDGLQKQALINKAQSLGLTNIDFLDPVPKSEIYQYIAQADVCTILWQDSDLYRWGTSANKIFDYMVMRKPIITASNSPYTQIGSLVPAANSAALAAAILQIYQMPQEQRKQLGEESFNHGKYHHDIGQLSFRLLEKMRLVVGANQDGTPAICPKRILVLVNNPLINDGRVVKQIRSLTQRDFDITVLCRSNDNSIFEFEGAKVVRNAGPFPVHSFSPLSTPSNKQTIRSRIYALIKRNFGYLVHLCNFTCLTFRCKQIDFCEFDLIHAHDLHTLPAANYLSKKYNIPFIYDAHEFETNNIDVTPLSKIGIYHIEKRYAQKAAKVITVCNEIADLHMKVYKINKPALIYNTPLSNCPASTVMLKQRLGLNDSIPLVVCIGHFTIPRARNEIMQAFVHEKTAHLAIVGSNPIYDQEILSYAQTLGIAHRLHLIEHQSPESLIHFISDADLSLLIFHDNILNHVYAMPNKLFESVFAKLPIVYYSKLLSITHFMKAFNIGYAIDNYESSTIAQAIRHVTENKKDYSIDTHKLAEITHEYAWEKQVDKLESIYHQLIAKRSSSCVESQEFIPKT